MGNADLGLRIWDMRYGIWDVCVFKKIVFYPTSHISHHTSMELGKYFLF